MKTRYGWACAVVLAAALSAIPFAGCSTNGAETGEGGSADAAVAAQVGDIKITMEELDAHVAETNSRAFQAWYDARRAGLDQLINERLVAAEAEKRGVTAEQLIQEATGNTGTVTDADIENFYNQNQARMGGRTLEQMSAQIREFLVRNGAQQAQINFYAGLRQTAAVKVFLEPPRVDVKVAADDPSMGGPADAPVLLVEFSDFQ